MIVIDGWGLSEATTGEEHLLQAPPAAFNSPPSLPHSGNAIKNAETPVMDALCAEQSVAVEASGLAVGLPPGLMGNSEVGHFTIGTGRVVYQVCSCSKV